MKKIILLFVMVFAVAGVQAKTSKLYSNFQSVANNNNVSWNPSTNTLSVWGSSANTYQMFSFKAGTLSNFEKLYIPIDNTNYAHIRIMLMNEGTTVFTGRFNGGGNKTITLEGWDSFGAKLTKEQIATITSIRIGGYEVSSYSSESPCTISIDPAETYLVSKEYEGNETSFSSLTTGGTWSNSLATLPLHVYKNGDTEEGKNLPLVGKDSGVSNYAEVGNVHAIIFKIRDITTVGGGAIRAFVCKKEDLDYTTVWAYPVSTTGDITWTTQPSKYSTEGYYYIDLTSWDRLVGIKTNSFSSATDYYISEVYLVKKALNITDGFDMADMVNDPLGATVNYNRTFNIDQKSTVCLPFALTEAEVTAAGTFYELTSAAAGTLTFSEVSETEAYKPYVFEAKTANPFASLTNKTIEASADATTSYTVDNYTFHGVLAHQNVPNGAYGYNAADGVFSKATSDAVTIDAFRGYITYNGGGAGARELNCIFSDGEVTGIETVRQSQQQDGVMYNLQGQRVGQNHKGLFIMNGRKYVVK